MATYSPEMLYKKINDVQETFGGLSQTSQFMVTLNLGRSAIRQSGIGPLNRYLTRCGLFRQSKSTEETYDFLCSDASLPGSSFDMAEESGTRQGIIERFPMRRIYANFDLTFYVDKEYNTIRIFEEWLNWIDPLSRGSATYDGDEDGQEGFDESNSFFRMRYPNQYKTKVSIVKFERGFWKNPNKVVKSDKIKKKLLEQPILKYDFIDAFPMNIAAIPFSYDGSSLTQVTVNFSYSRYTVSKQNPERKKENFKKKVSGLSNSNSGVSLNNAAPPGPLVGFINGVPYYGAFHEHVRDDGTIVRMVGAEHVPYPHDVIYATAAESITAQAGQQQQQQQASQAQQQASQQQEQEQQQQNNQQQQQQNNQQQQQQDTTAPNAPSNLSATSDSSDSTPSFTGNAEANSTIKLFVGSSEVGTATADSSGAFVVTVSSALTNGTYSFTMTSTDAAGNESSSSSIIHTINVVSGGGGSSGGGGGYGGGY